MAGARWRVRIGAEAERDLEEIGEWTATTFGVQQARRYRDIILSPIDALHAGPEVPGLKRRDDVGPGIRILQTARHGASTRHFLIVRFDDGERDLVVLRILHDSMDVVRHLPPMDEP